MGRGKRGVRGAGVYMNYMCKGRDCNTVRKVKMIPGARRTVFCEKCGATYDVTAADRLSSVLGLKRSM